jgi:hypothetical protein
VVSWIHDIRGVLLRSSKDPVLYLNDPEGITRQDKRKMLDKIAELNSMHYDEMQDSEIQSRIAQYEMAYRMQMSVPEVMNLNDEPESVIKLYGAEALIPGNLCCQCIAGEKVG